MENGSTAVRPQRLSHFHRIHFYPYCGHLRFYKNSMNLDAKIPSGPIAQKWDKHRFDLNLVNPANKRKYEVIVSGQWFSRCLGSSVIG